MMKTQFRCIWFALALSACNSDERTVPPAPQVTTNPVPAPVVIPAATVEDVQPLAPVAVEAPKPIPTKYSEAMEDGKAAVAKGDTAYALELFGAAAKLDRKQADPQIELARVYLDTKDKGHAIAAATKATKLAPKSSRAWNTLGRAELARWSYQGASDAFKKAAELDPDNAWAWNNLGFTELSFHSYQAAADALVVATSKANATGYMWNNLGTAYEHLDLLDEARDAFERGGKLGSKEAIASRKRLEGVEPMIATAHEPKKADKTETTYPHDESPSEAPVEPVTDAPVVESTAPAAEVPSTEVPTDAGVLPATL